MPNTLIFLGFALVVGHATEFEQWSVKYSPIRSEVNCTDPKYIISLILEKEVSAHCRCYRMLKGQVKKRWF